MAISVAIPAPGSGGPPVRIGWRSLRLLQISPHCWTNRIDRLTAMILMLQSHRVVTADQMASHLEISVRTVYRDVAALGEAGVPIVAEAGVGYALMRGYHMPPVMFTEEEAAAIFMSSELAEQFGDESLKRSMRSAMLKVRAALPADRRDYLGRLGDAVSVVGPSGYRWSFSEVVEEVSDEEMGRRTKELFSVQELGRSTRHRSWWRVGLTPSPKRRSATSPSP